jgi:hypothetical protein
MPKKFIQFLLRMPAPMYEALKRASEAERRSMTSQALIYLERGMPAGLMDETQADIAIAAEAGK